MRDVLLCLCVLASGSIGPAFTGTVDGAAANQMWWHSPGHHKNVLGNHTRVGLGRSGKYWTELFGR